ncbi:hypothetical protein [Streptomyces sp. DH12]|uniref:hypothetical protein n=1 Tax=Streptomyces sp. DH12 TaxID=2857010 RepID=UPI001E30A5D2|nr:hypothetical protein [Streptomyces sp. DH12]
MTSNSNRPAPPPPDSTTVHDEYLAAKAEAMRLVNQAHHFTYGDGADAVTGAALAAEAQVYATLAVAAATLHTAPTNGQSTPTTDAVQVRAKTLGDIAAMLARESRAYRSTRSPEHAHKADALDQMVTRLSRDAIRAVTPGTEAGGAADA